MSLLEFQRRMLNDVTRPLTPEFAMQTESAHEEGVAGYVTPNPRLSAFDRLEIYNRQYWFRVIDAVSDDYPSVSAALGVKRFNAMVLAYLRENPSVSWTLRDLGSRLPDWLARHPELTGVRHRLAVDVARLEWAYVESFDGGRLEPLTAEDLSALGPETQLALQPHIRLLELSYPVDELVMSVHKEMPETEIVSNAAVEHKQRSRRALPKMRRMPIHLAVHRYDNLVYYRRIDREMFLLLSALRDGLSIAEALGSAFAGSKLNPEEQAVAIQEYFAHAAELGWFCQFALDTPE